MVLEHTTRDFETAILAAGYFLYRIKKNNHGFVTKAEGSVSIVSLIIVDGCKKNKRITKKLRWDGNGHCFSFWRNKRLRKYDLDFKKCNNA